MLNDQETNLLLKVLKVLRRDGIRIAFFKILARLTHYFKFWLLFVLKRLLPPRAKEWIRCRLEPSLPVVKQKPLPSGTPLAAVIIPCFNYGKYLPAAVESALNQTLGNTEVIVVNDGSTEPLTLSVLKEIEKDPRISVINQENRGLPAARNAGIRVTGARYITCLDADDLIDPTYLEKAVTVLETRPDVGLAYSFAQLFGDVEEIWYTETLDPAKLLQYNHIPVVAVFRREAWEKVGGYDEDMRIGYEDWDFWLRLAREGYRGWLIPEPLFKHRRHGKTMTHRAQEKHVQLSIQLRKKYTRPAGAKQLRAVEVKPRQAFINIRGQDKPPGKKRLLSLVPWVTVGGAEAVLLQVLEAFTNSGNWETYIVTTLESPNEWAERFAAVTPNIYFLPHLVPRRYFSDWFAAFITRHSIDAVLISHSQTAYFALRHLREAVPDLLILDLLHNDSSEGYSETSARMDNYIDGHIVVHRGIKKKLVSDYGVPAGKVFIIPNGVDEERFKPRSAARTSLQEKLGLNPENLQVAFVGRLSKEKNPLLYVKAAAKLKDLPNIAWLCYGGGEILDELRAEAMALGSPVKFMGTSSNMTGVFNAVDLLVLTSEIEGLPMVVIEAMMSGVPVVATGVGCLADVIEPGVNGYLIDRGDLEGLCSVLRKLLTQPEHLEELKRHCRDSVLKKYSGSRMAQNYVRLFETLLCSKQESRDI